MCPMVPEAFASLNKQMTVSLLRRAWNYGLCAQMVKGEVCIETKEIFV